MAIQEPLQSPPSLDALVEENATLREDNLSLTQRLAHAEDTARHWQTVAAAEAKLKDHYKEMAYTDELTEVGNLRRLKAASKESFGGMADLRHGTGEDVLLFIDLDDFKKINTLHGHVVGDKCLVTLAHGLRDAIRDTDLLYRKGGDEFIIILKKTDLDSVNDVVISRLKKLLTTELHLDHEGVTIPIRGSIGIHEYNPAQSLMDNIEYGDAMMKVEKANRKRGIFSGSSFGDFSDSAQAHLANLPEAPAFQRN